MKGGRERRGDRRREDGKGGREEGKGGMEEGRKAYQPGQPILPASENLRQVSVLSGRSG